MKPKLSVLWIDDAPTVSFEDLADEISLEDLEAVTDETENDISDILSKAFSEDNDLIDNETGLNSMIEVAVQQIEDEKNRIEAAANAEEIDEEDKMFDYDNLNAVLSNEDFVDFSEFQEQLSGEDAEFYQQIMAGEDDD